MRALGTPALGVWLSVMFIGELMKLAEQSLAEGLHPRLIAEVCGWWTG